ncbi:MAG TPA: LytTR family DNA-binding domain-containing protein [Puia sp.]|nr:LytTR family DNA-binding domain-containing protein [Puia sp.]
MKDLRCLVVDDEPLAADVVVSFLQRLDVHAITRCENGIEAFRCLQEQTFDLLFLDIEMPQLSGFDLLKTLPHRPLVVITTAYRDHAVEGFEWEVLDYLVKPFSFPRFMKTMEKALRAETPSLDTDDKGFIFLKTDRQWTRVEISAILYVESLKDYIRVVLSSGEYICHQPLTDITATLPSGQFLRVHRSYTVALDKIDKVKHHCAYVRGKTIPISRANRAEVYRRLGQ